MGPIGVQEMIAIFVIALVLFGPKKLPELGRLLGKGLREFRRAKSELTATFETQLREFEREARVETSKTQTDDSAAASMVQTPSTYSYPYDENGSYDAGVQAPAEPAGLPSGAVARGSVALPSSDSVPAEQERTV